MHTDKNMPYYIAAAVFFIMLKIAFSFADNTDLLFLIKPVDVLVSLLTGSRSVFFADKGFYYDTLNILIDKSCSGFNFLLLCFLVSTYAALKHIDNPFKKIIAMPLALFGSYMLTIFANASRIFVALIIHTQTKKFLPNRQHVIHEAIGIVMYVTFLILLYLFIDKQLMCKGVLYAKRTKS